LHDGLRGPGIEAVAPWLHVTQPSHRSGLRSCALNRHASPKGAREGDSNADQRRIDDDTLATDI